MEAKGGSTTKGQERERELSLPKESVFAKGSQALGPPAETSELAHTVGILQES
jgi:hypothetical protein